MSALLGSSLDRERATRLLEGAAARFEQEGADYRAEGARRLLARLETK